MLGVQASVQTGNVGTLAQKHPGQQQQSVRCAENLATRGPV